MAIKIYPFNKPPMFLIYSAVVNAEERAESTWIYLTIPNLFFIVGFSKINFCLLLNLYFNVYRIENSSFYSRKKIFTRR